MYKKAFKRLLAVLIVFSFLFGAVPMIRVDEDGSIFFEMMNTPVSIEAYAVDGDALQSVATVTTGGSVSSYVDINSQFEPNGYINPDNPNGGKNPRGDGNDQSDPHSLGYTGTPNRLISYHTSPNGSTENTYLVTPTNDLSWIRNSSSTGVSGSLSDTAVSDYVPSECGVYAGNGAMCAKVNSKVIQIHALSDITLSFDWTVSMKMTKWQGTKAGAIKEGVYTLITTNPNPTASDMIGSAAVAISSKSLAENSPTEAADSGNDWTTALEEGQYLYLYFYGFFNNEISLSDGSDQYTFSASISDFKITPATESYTLTIGNIDCADNMIGGGKISVNNSSNLISIPSGGTATGLSDALSGTAVTLNVSEVPSGYHHIGWRIGNQILFQKTYSLSLNSNTTVYALLIPEVTVTMGSDGYTNASYSYKKPNGQKVDKADQYIARNSAATIYYKTLAEAFSDNNVVVLLGNIVLNGDFTIPNNKTLSVQCDWEDVASTELQHLAGNASTFIFAKATINGNVTLQGNLVASAIQSYSDSVNGRAIGGVGQIIVNGTIDVLSGANLCAYGMVTGTGQINVASGGSVYELMEIRDMRSIHVMPTVATGTGNAFPLNHYFIKTNEVSTTYNKGSALIGCYYVAVSGIRSNGTIKVIGTTDDSFFKIENGSLTKSFSSAAPYNNKTIIRAEDGSDIKTGHFSITIKTPVTDYPINTANYFLPINYCFAIEIMSGGSMTIKYNYKLLPGALVDIKEGGTLNIESGKNLVLYRANDYGFSGASNAFSASTYPAEFTKPSGLRYASNTAANVGSAKLNVDGTLNVAGGLYVTNQHRGKTTYPNGYNYLTGTGTINITGSLSNGSIKEWVQPDGNNAESVTVDYVPIKGITNDEATADNGQTDYNSFSTGTYYGWVNDSNVNVWTTSRPVTLSYDANGGSGAMASSRKPGGSSFTAAANAFTAPSGAVFKNWNTKADGTGTSYEVASTLTLSTDTVLYAQWKYSYIVSFDLGGATGTAPVNQTVYSGECATIPTAPTWTGHTFAGWFNGDNAWDFSTPVSASMTLTAHWTVNTYTITWKNDDGTTLETDTDVPYGTTPTYDGATPTKEGNAQYTYTFSRWSPTVVAATQNATYTAVFDQTLNKYQISWAYQYRDKNNVMQTGTLKESEEKEYGSQIAFWVPSKASDADGVYTFDRWTRSLPATVSGDATYTAVFTRTDAAVITYLPGGGTGAAKYQYVGYGLSYKLEANSFAREGYTFLRWIGDNGRTYEKDDLVRVTSEMGHLTLTAEWTPNDVSTAQIKIQWYDNYTSDSEKDISNATVFKTDYFDSAERFAEPVAPSHPGYTFYAWAVYLNGNWETSISETVDSGTTLTTREKLTAYLSALSEKKLTENVLDVYALYTNNQTQCPVEVLYKLDGEVVNWTNVIQDVPEQATVGKYLRLNATPEYNGKTFDHWEYDSNTIKTDNLKITPGQQTAGETITIYACYVSGEASDKDLFYIVETYAEVVNGVPKVAVTLGWNLESGSVTEVGFYAGKDQSKVQNKESAKASMKPSNPTNGTYTLHISSKTGTDVPIYALPFATYTDASGQSHPWVGEAITLVWSDLSLKGDG